jgi:ribonuclease-3
LSDASADLAPPDLPLAPLAQRLGYVFGDGGLLRTALCHRSWCAEHEGQQSNERLEFLGDAVLGLAVTDHTFRTYAGLPEGSMAKVRAAVVSSVSLAELAAELGLGEHLLLGRGEEATGGRNKPSILADAMEAVIGAVYVDGGWEPARGMVVDLLAERIASAVEGPGVRDFKTRLQELAARRFDTAPRYLIEEAGPDHDKWFRATVLVDGVVAGQGEGRSKKLAQQAAAETAWHHLSRVTGPDEEPTDA